MADASDFRRLAELLPDALLLVDDGGTVVAANRAAAAVFGIDAAALVGSALAAHVAGGAARVGSLLRSGARSASPTPGTLTLALADGPRTFRCDAALFRAAASPRRAEVLLRLVPKDAAVVRFLALNERIDALSREVERRRAVEAELHAYSERLRVTLASIGDAMIATDVDGRVTMMNGVAEALTGWREAEAAGRPVEEVFVILDQRTRGPVENPVRKALRAGRVVGLGNDTLLVARDGTEYSIDDSGAPIVDRHGAIGGVVLVFRDITERYAMQRALQQQSADLIDADRRKDEFLSMLAHELRNPLAPLSTGVHLLLSRDLAGDAARRVAQMLQRQVGHLTRLVDDLLDVARLTRGRIELQREPAELAELLQRAVEMIRPAIDARGHALDVVAPPRGLRVHVDPARIVQVLSNLLSNAAKFTPPHGRIDVACQVDTDAVRITVRDDGVGIEPALLPRVFELFVQGDRALDRNEGGLGIGLTVVRTLVESHGGSITAHSGGAGCGSEFVVTLPLAGGSEPDAAGAAAGGPTEAPRRVRVVVVDDNVDAGESLRDVLELWGHDARLVTTPQGALDGHESFAADAWLIDIGLPGMNGYELARRLRVRPGGGRPLLVAVTGYGQALERQASRDAGFDDHLTKPVDLDRLQELLARRMP